MLRKQVIEVTRSAYQQNALKRMVADHQTVYDPIYGLKYLVFSLKPTIHKPDAMSNPVAKPSVFRDPFAKEYIEKDLMVTQINGTHNLLLNKYNVVDEHVVLATIDYESQEDPVNVKDFQAMWTCMEGMDAFAFFNCGYASGASQPHKHMQLISYPSLRNYTGNKRVRFVYCFLCHLSNALKKYEEIPSNTILQLQELPFRHFLHRIDHCKADNSDVAGYLHRQYEIMYAELCQVERPQSVPVNNDTENSETIAYNLLLTSEFLMLVPRKMQSYYGIEVNSIGFTGSFLGRTREQMDFLTGNTGGVSGPMKLLQEVTFPQNHELVVTDSNGIDK